MYVNSLEKDISLNKFEYFMLYKVKKGLFLIIFLLLILASCGISNNASVDNLNTEIIYGNITSNNSLSGEYYGNQVWKGNILITGDTIIKGDLTIFPGTTVLFELGDDKKSGEEIESDGFNNLDPTRLKKYTISHSELIVQGKMLAKGEKENMILFTSSSPNPKLADWVGIRIEGDNSIIEYSIIEWSRNGIAIVGHQPNTIVQNNIINNTFWGGINLNMSSAQIYNNKIFGSGHGAIDILGGRPIIENNKINDSRTGIVILDGSPKIRNNLMTGVGRGYYIGENATPDLKNNTIVESYNLERVWIYEDFFYHLVYEPLIE